jgi:hypothetical protein
MKVYFYIKPKELEYLSKILKEKYNKYQAEPIEISFNPKNDSAMVSLSIDDFIGLSDRGCFSNQIYEL